MNQILVTQKLYITPELKRKKKIYKFDFILSIFLMVVLISVYIYAEYDRNKSAEVSQEILEQMQVAQSQEYNETDETTAKNKNVLVVVLDDSSQNYEQVEEQTEEQTGEQTNSSTNKQTTSSGFVYETVASISIPKINVNLPILEGETGSTEETEALLKISPCKFWGPDVNETGNYCIVGHNYRNLYFFSKVPTLVSGDTFTITDTTGRTITYEIYDKYTVDPSNLSCTSQLTGGKKEVTLITCTDDSSARVIVKAREVE